MFKFKKNEKKNKKNSIASKLFAAAMILSLMPYQVQGASAAEGTGIDGIVTSTTSTVTSVMGELWTMISGNAYLSFGVGVSIIAGVIMLFKRLIGASRR